MPAATQSASAPTAEPDAATLRRGRIKLVILFLLFASPVIASYLTYYVFQPTGRTNYGELVSPQRAVAEGLLSQQAEGDFALNRLRGKWIMLTGLSRTDEPGLADRLYAIRQVRLTTGKDMDRIERVLVQVGDQRIDPALRAQHEGLVVLRATPAQWDAIFSQPTDRILVIDPLGNLMMRFPERADPNKMKKDVSKLLRASRIG